MTYKTPNHKLEAMRAAITKRDQIAATRKARKAGEKEARKALRVLRAELRDQNPTPPAPARRGRPRQKPLDVAAVLDGADVVADAAARTVETSFAAPQIDQTDILVFGRELVGEALREARDGWRSWCAVNRWFTDASYANQERLRETWWRHCRSLTTLKGFQLVAKEVKLETLGLPQSADEQRRAYQDSVRRSSRLWGGGTHSGW